MRLQRGASSPSIALAEGGQRYLVQARRREEHASVHFRRYSIPLFVTLLPSGCPQPKPNGKSFQSQSPRREEALWPSLPIGLDEMTLRKKLGMALLHRSRAFPIATALLLLFTFSAVRGDTDTEARSGGYPIVISTWPFVEAVRAAWRAVEGGASAVDAVVDGCSACEELRCDGTVGPGGSPDENGETTIDALIMNGTTMEIGAVAAMRYVKDGIRAAKLVLEHTKHTLLVGEQASIFSISMGLPGPTDLSSPDSIMKWKRWKNNSCQPNFRKNVIPVNGCGPYHARDSECTSVNESCAPAAKEKCSGNNILGVFTSNSSFVSRTNHDTISMAVIDKTQHIAVGTSTNGATFKIPGRVGDGPIAGSSAYADDEVGACGATGDGDVMMRFLPCYQVVESMRQGMEPKHAAADAISRIARKYPDFVGAVFAINKDGVHAGACHGWTFQYSVRALGMEDVEVFTVVP